MKNGFTLISLLLIISVSFGQVLPTNRSVNWSLAGYRGTIPNYSTLVDITAYSGIGNGIGTNDTALTNAINSLSGTDGVIYFPAGTYLFNSPINLRSGLILRGTSSDSTTLKFDFGTGSTSSSININGALTSTSADISINATKDSSYIYVSDASNLLAGDYLKISFNDSSLLFSSWAYGSVGQIVKVASITSNKITLESPLRLDYNLSKHPKITKMNPITGVGIECLKIQRMDATPGQTSNIRYNCAAQCWISGIEGYMCNFAHVEINSSTNISIKGSYFHEAFAYGGNGQGYGALCQSTSGECLIENNVFKHLRHSMLIQAGANGNVYGYNYSLDPNWTEPNFPSNSGGDMVLHGNYAYANLFEGNIGQNIVVDDSHGENGYYNTFFRNRGELYGIVMNTNPASNNQNLIGNEITNSGFALGFYYINGTGHFQFGNNVRGTIYASGTNTLPDVSYYYSTVPAFLQNLSNWPSVGIPNTINTGTIPAKDRYLSGAYTTCSTPSITTSIIDYSMGSFNVFPNPSNGMISIQNINKANLPLLLDVYDCIGNRVEKFTLISTEQTLDLSRLSKGIYILKVIADIKGYQPIKLVVQ